MSINICHDLFFNLDLKFLVPTKYKWVLALDCLKFFLEFQQLIVIDQEQQCFYRA